MEAHLGLASTQELLDEVKARADVDATLAENDAIKRIAREVVDAMNNILRWMPPHMLAYRTVDGRKSADASPPVKVLDEPTNATERPEDTIRRYAQRLIDVASITHAVRPLSADECERIHQIVTGHGE